jgi:hypothetical protein
LRRNLFIGEVAGVAKRIASRYAEVTCMFVARTLLMSARAINGMASLFQRNHKAACTQTCAHAHALSLFHTHECNQPARRWKG